MLTGAAQCLNEPATEFGVRQATLAREEVLPHFDHASIIELIVEVVPELTDGGLAIDHGSLVRHDESPPSRPS
jgi:hypothetical protein